jgi:ABC-type uncharacterized transport system substrate-binding protein
VLTDSRVLQYRSALTTAKEVLHNPHVLELGAPDLQAQLGQAAAAGTIILAIGQKALLVAQQTGAAVVFCMVLGPAAVPGKTVTGLRLEVAPEVQLTYFRRVHASLRRLGVVYNPRNWASYVQEATQAATARGLSLIAKPVADAREVRAAVSDMAANNIDGLWLLPDPQLITVEVFNFLLVYTLERKIALFGFFEDFTRAGALASVSPDYAAIGRLAGKLAAEIAARPVESRLPLPPSIASPGVLTINAKTAQQLWLDIPEDVLSSAVQVYR